MRVNLCQYREEVTEALSELGCLRKESTEGSKSVVSLGKLGTLMSGLAGVQVLERGEAMFGLRVVCSCPRFIRSGQCEHELFVRFLRGDRFVVGAMKDYTHVPRAARKKARGGSCTRNSNVPALGTMEVLNDRVKKLKPCIFFKKK